MSPTLPTELIHHIIDEIPYDVTTLSRCCLVSKTFFSRSHPKLYGTFVIGIGVGLARARGDISDNTSRVRKSSIARMRSMNKNPVLISLLKFIRSSDVPLEEEEDDSLQIVDISPDLFVSTLISFYQKSSNPPKLELLESCVRVKYLDRSDHLTALKISISHLDNGTWNFLDKAVVPNLLHLRLDFAESYFVDAPPSNFAPPSLVSGEITGDHITTVNHLRNLFVNSNRTLRRLRLPLQAFCRVPLHRFNNLIEFVVTNLGTDTPSLSVKLFLYFLRNAKALETLSIYGESPSETYNSIFESGTLAKALPPTVRTLNVPQARIRQIVLLFCDAGSNGVHTLGYPINLVGLDVEYRAIKDFCRVKGLRGEQCSSELPDWNPISVRRIDQE